MLWFKGSRQIPFVNTDRYTFEDGATTLVIHQFDQIDAASYLFVYANNVTRTRVLFHLDLRPSSGKCFFLFSYGQFGHYCCAVQTNLETKQCFCTYRPK